MIARLKYLKVFKDRTGRERIYLRRKGHPEIALPARNDPGFMLAYANALASTKPVKPVQRDPGSLYSACDAYLQSAAFAHLGDSTAQVYKRIIAKLCREHGTKPLAMLTDVAVRKLMDRMGNTPASANHFRRTLSAVCDHALSMGKIDANPCVNVKRLKEVGEGAETWTEQDISLFEKRWAIGTKPRLALALLLYTAQRRSDVVRMGKQMVRDGVLTLRQQKTKTVLDIPLHSDLQTVLATVPHDQLTFLITEQGRPFSSDGFYMRFREWCRDAGVPDGRSPHGLRKAACRRLAEAGCSEREIASVSGHKSMAEISTYVRAAEQAKLARKAISRIGKPEQA